MVRSFALAVAFAMAAAAPSPVARTPAAPSRGYWLQAVPADDGETAVHAAVTDPALAGTADGARALRDLADQHPRGAAAGLARLAAGLTLLDQQQYAEAEPLLLDGEIEKTQLEDHAWKALAELYEKTGAVLEVGRATTTSWPRARTRIPSAASALLRGADVKAVLGRRDEALAMLQRALAGCPGREPQALLQLGAVQEQRGQRRGGGGGAGPARPRLSGHRRRARRRRLRLRKLAAAPARRPRPQEKIGRDLKKALVLFEAGEHRAAVKLFQALLLRKPIARRTRTSSACGWAGRSSPSTRTRRPGRRWPPVRKGSAVEPEAAYFLARLQAGRPTSPAAYDSVATRFPGTSWGEEALLDARRLLRALGQGRGRAALLPPHLRGLPARQVHRPRQRSASASGSTAPRRFDKAAEIFEAAAKVRSSNLWRPGLPVLGRARAARAGPGGPREGPPRGAC